MSGASDVDAGLPALKRPAVSLTQSSSSHWRVNERVLPYLVLLPALGVFYFVVTIVGAIRAYEGNAYRYPLCIRFIG